MNRRTHPKRPRKSLLGFGVAALLAMTAATAQVAGGLPGASGIDASGNYQAEVQACRDGRTQQDIDTCLREARNAQAERRSGTLRQPSPDYDANALARCEPLQGEEKAACKARVLGFGNTSGSVAGGGVLREVETVVMPQGTTDMTIVPKTSDPVVLVPVPIDATNVRQVPRQ
jgi:hypothetical protein